MDGERVQLLDEFQNFRLRDFSHSTTLREILARCRPSYENIRDIHTLFGVEGNGAAMQAIVDENQSLVRFLDGRNRRDPNCSVTLAMLVEFLESQGALSAAARTIREDANLIVQEIQRQVDNQRITDAVNVQARMDQQGLNVMIRNIPSFNRRQIKVIFHSSQLSPERFRYFMSRIRQVFQGQLQFEEFDLAEKTMDNINILFPIREPVIVIYDRDLHEKILNLDHTINPRDDKQVKQRRFFHLVYDQYCRSGYTNEFVYPFCLEEFGTSYTKDNHFKYAWLLQKLDNQQSRERLRVAKFKQIPADIENGRSREYEEAFLNELGDFKDKFNARLVRA